MKVFFNIEEFIVDRCNDKQNFSASIGNFDGVHLGHQQIFRILENESTSVQQENILITFEPNPKLFHKPQKNFLLTTLDEKIDKIKESGIIDNFLVLDFNPDMKSMSAQEFIENILIKKLRINQLIIGENFRFGKNQLGDINLLEEYFVNKLIVVRLLHQNNVISSSTIIKNHIQNGEIMQANELLGYQYFIRGVVIEGNKLARQLGFPTANIKNTTKILPKFGVYKVLITIQNGKKLSAIANIGVKPTIGLDTEPTLEVHIPNFSGDFYGSEAKVEFVKFIREEKKFNSLEELVRQIENDVSCIDENTRF